MDLGNWICFLLAAVPVIWLLISLGMLKMPSYGAAAIAFAATAAISLTYFAMPAVECSRRQSNAVMLALFSHPVGDPVGAVCLHTTLATGAMDMD
jgi:lactate permease